MKEEILRKDGADSDPEKDGQRESGPARGASEEC
jgi:hypothetical protein